VTSGQKKSVRPRLLGLGPRDRGYVSSTRRREGQVDPLLAARACGSGVTTILWIIAAVLVIAGIVTLVRGGLVAGVVLIIVGLLIGPGGASIFC
jgi:hypothetical protein